MAKPKLCAIDLTQGEINSLHWHLVDYLHDLAIDRGTDAKLDADMDNMISVIGKLEHWVVKK